MSERAPFIPAALDDAGLDVYEFRVYCRVSRRGSYNESVPNAARALGISEALVQRSLLVLTAAGALDCRPHPGHATEYRARPVSEWTDLDAARASVAQSRRHNLDADRKRKARARSTEPSTPVGNEGGTPVGNDPAPPLETRGVAHSTPVGNEGGVPLETRGVPPLETRGVPPLETRDEGTPSEGTPSKVTSSASSDRIAKPDLRARAGDAGAAGAHEEGQVEGGENGSPDQLPARRFEGVAVPLSPHEKDTYRERMQEVWARVEAAPLATPLEPLLVAYSLTFGQRMTSTGSTRGVRPTGETLTLLRRLDAEWPLSWLVCAFVVTSAKDKPFAHVPRFLQPWADSVERGTAPVRTARPLPVAPDAAPAAPSVPRVGAAPQGPKPVTRQWAALQLVERGIDEPTEADLDAAFRRTDDGLYLPRTSRAASPSPTRPQPAGDGASTRSLPKLDLTSPTAPRRR